MLVACTGIYLSDIIDGVVLHGLDEGESVFVACSSASYAESHGCSVTHVRVVRFGQQLYNAYMDREVISIHIKRKKK